MLESLSATRETWIQFPDMHVTTAVEAPHVWTWCGLCIVSMVWRGMKALGSLRSSVLLHRCVCRGSRWPLMHTPRSRRIDSCLLILYNVSQHWVQTDEYLWKYYLNEAKVFVMVYLSSYTARVTISPIFSGAAPDFGGWSQAWGTD